ncbi:hypothetical protein [Vibrio phage 29Fa.3]|nr:hypothetical protein [Vibrio phage 29Fa.3]
MPRIIAIVTTQGAQVTTEPPCITTLTILELPN